MNQILSSISALPKRVTWLLVANVVSFVGLGLTLQYTLIYLSSVRGIELWLASLLVSFSGVFGLLGSPIAGWLVDRFGARRVLWWITLSWALSNAAFGFVQDAISATIVASIVSLSGNMRYPAFSALIGTQVSEDQRSNVFSLNYAGINLGIGVGGVMAGFFIELSQAQTFMMAFIAQAVLTLAVLPFLTDPQLDLAFEHKAHPTPSISNQGFDFGMGIAFRDIKFVLLWLVSFLFWFNVFQLNNLLPLYATQLGLSPQILGIAIGLNTMAIVILQMPVFAFLAGKRRSRAGALMFLCIGVSYLLLLGAGWVNLSLAAVLVALTPGLIGIAETIMSPVMPPLVISLAPTGMVGRYNGAYALSTSLVSIIAPLTAGLFVQANAAPLLIIIMILSSFIAMGLSVLLGRRVGQKMDVV
jgi:MFS family permease